MKQMKRVIFVAMAVMLSLAVVGCTAQTPTPAPATETSLPEPTTPVVADLTLEQVKNAEYTFDFGESMPSFTLVDGTYQSGTDTSQQGYFQATLSDKVAFGDLNGDGLGTRLCPSESTWVGRVSFNTWLPCSTGWTACPGRLLLCRRPGVSMP
jgi:hypothetical protein